MFDFITDEQLRASLKSDYAELLAASQVQAWKAVHVLAGSIIEAILVDYLMSISFKPAKGRPLLEMQLGDLITACKVENILTDETENLSTVVKDYRNLIHPGRGLRLQRKATQSTARVAQSLVEIIVEEISQRKRETYGYTAEQVVDKLERDHSAFGILSHLIAGMKQSIEIERFLTQVLPERFFYYLDLIGREEPVGRTLATLRKCFRPVFDAAPDEIKAKVTKNFVRILREENQTNVVEYEESFFKCKDLEFVDKDEAELVKRHILARFSDGSTRDLGALLRVTDGIGPYLTPSEATNFAQAICFQLSKQTPYELVDVEGDLGLELAVEFDKMLPAAQERFTRRYEQWIQAFRDNNEPEIVELLTNAQRWWTQPV